MVTDWVTQSQADSVFRTVAARRDQLAPYDRATLDYFHDGFVKGDWETAYNGAKRMVELAPAAGHALWALGLTARSTYRPRESIAVLERIDLSTGWGREWAVRICGEIARDYHILGEFDNAVKAARRMLEFAPSDGYARTEEAVNLAAGLRYAELAERVEAAGALPDDPGTWEPFTGGDLLPKWRRRHAAPLWSRPRHLHRRRLGRRPRALRAPGAREPDNPGMGGRRRLRLRPARRLGPRGSESGCRAAPGGRWPRGSRP